VKTARHQVQNPVFSPQFFKSTPKSPSARKKQVDCGPSDVPTEKKLQRKGPSSTVCASPAALGSNRANANRSSRQENDKPKGSLEKKTTVFGGGASAKASWSSSADDEDCPRGERTQSVTTRLARQKGFPLWRPVDPK
jgi:hypothetical protein